MRWGWPPAFRILIQSLRPVMLAVYMAQRLCNLGHCLVSRGIGQVPFGPFHFSGNRVYQDLSQGLFCWSEDMH